MVNLAMFNGPDARIGVCDGTNATADEIERAAATKEMMDFMIVLLLRAGMRRESNAMLWDVFIIYEAIKLRRGGYRESKSMSTKVRPFRRDNENHFGR